MRNHFRRLSERICFSSSCLKIHIFPLRSLISVKKITCWPKKSSQGCLCIEAAVRNHFLRLSERFCFVLLLFKNAHFYFEELDFCEWCWPKKSPQGCLCIEAIVRNHFLRLSERFCFVLFLFENARFPLRSLISVSCWPNKSSQKCLYIKTAAIKHFLRLWKTSFLFSSWLKNGLPET